MTKLFTEIERGALGIRCSLADHIMLLGSCFADNIGSRMHAALFDVTVNPFGTLYNPLSLLRAVQRLDAAAPYGPHDCVPMGAGAGLVCSFEHHTSFARPTAEEFLSNANAALEHSRATWKICNKVIITLGTAFVWEHGGFGDAVRDAARSGGFGAVSNCLKRPPSEFQHRRLSVQECADALMQIVAAHPEKEFIFTVSPIRHLSQGAHENTLSKATLHLALEQLTGQAAGVPDTGRIAYFPAWEILCDQLRDYRFYDEDLVHPSKTAVDIIWERFLEDATVPQERLRIEENLRESRRQGHIRGYIPQR